MSKVPMNSPQVGYYEDAYGCWREKEMPQVCRKLRLGMFAGFWFIFTFYLLSAITLAFATCPPGAQSRADVEAYCHARESAIDLNPFKQVTMRQMQYANCLGPALKRAHLP